jgi:large subunit ribosomal protein L32
MPVPKRRTSKSKRDKRRAHDSLTAVNTISCPQCGESTLPHRICRHCGTYRGRQLTEAEQG